VNRPILIPGLPRVWRGPHELQLGADPSRARSLELPDPRAAQILDLLDGTRSERGVLLRAAEQGIPLDQARALLDTLQAAGLVIPAAELLPTGQPHESRRRLIGEAAALALTTASGRRTPAGILRRRAECRVVLIGHGRLGAPIAVALAESGVGAIEADLPGLVTPGELPGGPLRGTDLGRPRRDSIADAVLRAAPGLRSLSVRNRAAPTSRPPSVRDPAAPDPSSPSEPDPAAPDPSGPSEPDPATRGGRVGPVRDPAATLVVALDHDGPPGLPHLAVTIREGVPLIGPFVPASGDGPCRHCLELHRRDRDAAWPGSGGRRPRPDDIQPCTVATLLAATAFATAEALTHLDGGRPQTLGAAVEITAPGRLRRRRWPSHPACRCARGPNHPRH
jgi:hypothetical protein